MKSRKPKFSLHCTRFLLWSPKLGVEVGRGGWWAWQGGCGHTWLQGRARQLLPYCPKVSLEEKRMDGIISFLLQHWTHQLALLTVSPKRVLQPLYLLCLLFSLPTPASTPRLDCCSNLISQKQLQSFLIIFPTMSNFLRLTFKVFHKFIPKYPCCLCQNEENMKICCCSQNGVFIGPTKHRAISSHMPLLMWFLSSTMTFVFLYAKSFHFTSISIFL